MSSSNTDNIFELSKTISGTSTDRAGKYDTAKSGIKERTISRILFWDVPIPELILKTF